MASITTRASSGQTNGTGAITTSTSSTLVTGTGTSFTSQITAGKALFTSGGVYLGTVNAVVSNTSIILNINAAASVTSSAFVIGSYNITVKGTPLTNAEIDANFLSLNDSKLETSWAGSTTLVKLGTVTTGTWNATTLATGYGGTGLTTFNSNGAVYATNSSTLVTGTLPISSGGTGLSTAPTNGQIDIGNGTGFVRTTITGTTNQVTVTNGYGSITLSTPQDLASASNVQFGSIGIGTAASGSSGELRATSQITSYYSDERLKENITLIPDALSKVMTLRGVTYNANELAESFGYKDKSKQVGVLAADVEKVLPEAVKPAPFDIIRIDENTEISRSGENYKTVQYEKIVPLLVEAIKELNNEIKKLKGIK